MSVTEGYGTLLFQCVIQIQINRTQQHFHVKKMFRSSCRVLYLCMYVFCPMLERYLNREVWVDLPSPKLTPNFSVPLDYQIPFALLLCSDTFYTANQANTQAFPGIALTAYFVVVAVVWLFFFCLFWFCLCLFFKLLVACEPDASDA